MSVLFSSFAILSAWVPTGMISLGESWREGCQREVFNLKIDYHLEEKDCVCQTYRNHCNAETKVTIKAKATLDEA